MKITRFRSYRCAVVIGREDAPDALSSRWRLLHSLRVEPAAAPTSS
jgi:hypothetical protein